MSKSDGKNPYEKDPYQSFVSLLSLYNLLADLWAVVLGYGVILGSALAMIASI